MSEAVERLADIPGAGRLNNQVTCLKVNTILWQLQKSATTLWDALLLAAAPHFGANWSPTSGIVVGAEAHFHAQLNALLCARQDKKHLERIRNIFGVKRRENAQVLRLADFVAPCAYRVAWPTIFMTTSQL